MTAESLGKGSRGVVRALLPDERPAATAHARRIQLTRSIPAPTSDQVWLLLAVLGRALPTSDQVETAVRLARHRGMRALLAEIRRERSRPAAWLRPRVRVVKDAILLDVHDSATSALATGAQRVAREVALDWLVRQDVQLVGWSSSRTALLAIDSSRFAARERRGLIRRGPIVPWGGNYVLVESLNEPARASRIQAIAQFSGVHAGMTGNDAIPLTTAETTGPGMPGVFAKYLAAASRMNIIAPISEAAATEFAGWKRMLASAGLPGPTITTVPLAASVPTPDPSAEQSARERLAHGDLPLVLCVGSHEPRKNHLAVLHAAETLWRDGVRFGLSFVGGNAWNSEEFRNQVARLAAAGRPIRTVSGSSDAELWWGYRLARLSVFPSLNEGFGLPVAESLYAGTPVVASDFGSLAEIARSGGCLLVDPRDDSAIADGIRRLLTDDKLHAKLQREAAAISPRDWAAYAAELWRVLVN